MTETLENTTVRAPGAAHPDPEWLADFAATRKTFIKNAGVIAAASGLMAAFTALLVATLSADPPRLGPQARAWVAALLSDDTRHPDVTAVVGALAAVGITMVLATGAGGASESRRSRLSAREAASAVNFQMTAIVTLTASAVVGWLLLAFAVAARPLAPMDVLLAGGFAALTCFLVPAINIHVSARHAWIAELRGRHDELARRLRVLGDDAERPARGPMGAAVGILLVLVIAVLAPLAAFSRETWATGVLVAGPWTLAWPASRAARATLMPTMSDAITRGMISFGSVFWVGMGTVFVPLRGVQTDAELFTGMALVLVALLVPVITLHAARRRSWSWFQRWIAYRLHQSITQVEKGLARQTELIAAEATTPRETPAPPLDDSSVATGHGSCHLGDSFRPRSANFAGRPLQPVWVFVVNGVVIAIVSWVTSRRIQRST